ncbi:LacI family DNA-binding transcriptional regulator [Microlunatus parietis]|nr:LacI family DNA-binding transcriptional regulator [Microlunatus parietis]
MADVARRAGVSTMTVSHVINGNRPVRDETRARVLAAIEELDYQPNLAARALRRGRVGAIGLAVGHIEHPYNADLARAVTAQASALGYHVAIEATGGQLDAEVATWQRSPLFYDGLLINATQLERLPDGVRNDFPVVFLGESMSDPAVDHVAMANVEGTRLATRHLLDKGCRRIAMAGGSLTADTRMVTLRTEGYVSALTEAGLPVDPALVVRTAGGMPLQAGAATVAAMVAAGTRFDGVVCTTDSYAHGVLRGLADAGLGCPEGVRVVGFDNLPDARYAIPSLTSVDPDNENLVAAALAMLIERMEGFTGPGRSITGTCSLIERESTR